MTAVSMRCVERWLLALLLAIVLPAQAHKASDAYLFFSVEGERVDLRWDIALRDLDAVVDIDADGDRALTWGEFKAAAPAIEAYAMARLQVPGCRWMPGGRALERRSDGVYAVLQASASCTLPAAGAITYRLFAETDPTHRGIAKITTADGVSRVLLLGPQGAAGADAAPADAAPASFIAAGAHHIFTGYDHVLFLICLLLPAVLRRTPTGWQPVEHWQQGFWPVVGIVTLFTLAHSITLGLAALGYVSLPGWFVEPAIAVTIVVAAADNLRPLFGRWRGLVTFVFGLVHGFGFAGVLGELELPPAAFGWALFQFNLGIELGQLGIVALVAPLLLAWRHTDGYRIWVLRCGSWLAIGVALWWLAQRTVPGLAV